MASTLCYVDTQHEDMIHDAQLDYYGKRLATCSSDRTIKIFETGENNSQIQVAEIKGHEGPIWQIAWAHPKFGSLLASCSYDRRACVWKEISPNQWSKIYEYDSHESSVNSISWAPQEFGLCLACASSDGSISILTYKNDTWEVFRISQAHSIGVNAVSWCCWASSIPLSNSILSGGSIEPNTSVSQLAQQPLRQSTPVKRLVSGGCDNLVKIWGFFDSENTWKLEEKLIHHTDWVRDVAWAPSIGLNSSIIASCSQDGTVAIWTQDSSSSDWVKKVLPKFPDVVWRLSWSITGNILAVSGGDNKVSLWKEFLDSEWKCISELDDA